jgi:hypothetical protein
VKVGIACRYKFGKENKDARSVVYSNSLVEVLTQTLAQGKPPKDGQGTLLSPYKLRDIGEWIFCATQKPKSAPTYFDIGSRLIAQWGEGGGMFVNYCTDVTAQKGELESKCGSGNYEKYVDGLGDYFKERDEKEYGLNPKLPSYTRKGLRVKDLDDGTAVLICRSLISGSDDCGGCEEIPCSLASLLLGEGRRSSITFVISLMLLDLIETRTTYGKGGEKHYTWKSMLMYDTDKIPGRGDTKKGWAKHPMVGPGSKAHGDVGNVLDGSKANPVANKSLSIMSAWLAHYLQKKFGPEPNPKYKYYLLREDGSSLTHQPTPQQFGRTIDDKGNRVLRQACSDAVAQRYASSGLLIGGTTVEYEGLDGNSV